MEKIPPIFPSISAPKRQTINFILPLSGRYESFERFLKLYEEICIKSGEQTRLYVVLYKEDFEKSDKLIRGVQLKYRESGVSVVYINEEFSRAKALDCGLNLLSDEDLVLFIDVDMIFDTKSLQRIRQNTRKGRSVYFPIVYSLYNPQITNRTYLNFSIDQETGFWRQFGFGIVSLYKSDYRDLGGFNLLISGWGFEDVTFYDNVIKSKLKIIRSVDPGLVHVYHSINCDINLDEAQKNMCLGTQANILGTLKQLQEIYQKYKFLFR